VFICHYSLSILKYITFKFHEWKNLKRITLKNDYLVFFSQSLIISQIFIYFIQIMMKKQLLPKKSKLFAYQGWRFSDGFLDRGDNFNR